MKSLNKLHGPYFTFLIFFTLGSWGQSLLICNGFNWNSTLFMLLILISDCSEDCDGGAVVESPSGECNSFAKIVKNYISYMKNVEG